MQRIILAIAVACLAACGCSDTQKEQASAPQASGSVPTQHDNDLIQGEWVAVSGEESGEPIPVENISAVWVSFIGDKFAFGEGTHADPESTFSLDPAQAPQQIDLEQDGRVKRGIYELNGDDLRLCLGRETRPSAFATSQEHKGILLLTLKRKRSSPEQEVLQGTWEVVSAERGGKTVPATSLEGWQITFQGDKITLELGEEKTGGIFTVDHSQKPPAIDVAGGEGVILGIYSLEGDTLRYCWQKGGKGRPKEFATGANDDKALLVLKRP